MYRHVFIVILTWMSCFQAIAAPQLSASLSDGDFSALAADGSVWAAGYYDSYKIYYPLCGDEYGGVADIGPGVVKQVPGLTDVVAVSGSAALKTDGTVWSWRHMTYSRKRYDGAHVAEGGDMIGLPLAAEPVSGLSGVVQIAAFPFNGYGRGGGYALRSDGTVWHWDRKIADDDPTHPCYFRKWQLTPVEQVAGIDQVISLKISYYEAVALKSDGSVWTWKHTRPTPVQMPGLDSVVAIFAGGDNGFAIKADGSVFGWGVNHSLQLAGAYQGYSSATPVAITALGNDVKQIVIGGDFMGAVKKDGSVWAWGVSHGQICPEGNTPCPAKTDEYPDATVPAYRAPVKLRGVGNDYLSFSAGGVFTLVKSDGSIHFIGNTGNGFGMVNDNSLAQGGYDYFFTRFPTLNLVNPPPKSGTDRILDWAEQDYASLFAPAGIATRDGAGYTFRYYPHTDTYLGTKDGRVWFLPPGAPLSAVIDVGAQADRLGEAKAKGF